MVEYEINDSYTLFGSYGKTFEDDFIISDFTKTTRNEALFYREIKRLNNVEDLESLYGRVSVKIPCLIDQMQV